MNVDLSPNTQAILLLTAPLILGRGGTATDLLTPGEFNRLARSLVEAGHEPAELLGENASDVLDECKSVLDPDRADRLLQRGYLLSQAVERWRSRAMWVVSRADEAYPRRLKSRLRGAAPALLYGCGDAALLETGGLAVVGSRHVQASLIEYAESVGRVVARARQTLISGGAKGIDQAAMRGAIEAGGRVVGVLADSLERTVMNREHRDLILQEQLVLASPYDPSAGFNVGNAMQRNKLLYALSDAALVVSADFNKGGTWAGAIEQLDKLRIVPVYVRSTGELEMGLKALMGKGALPWPNAENAESLLAAMHAASPAPVQRKLSFGLEEESAMMVRE